MTFDITVTIIQKNKTRNDRGDEVEEEEEEEEGATHSMKREMKRETDETFHLFSRIFLDSKGKHGFCHRTRMTP
jgi:hypothetical protein